MDAETSTERNALQKLFLKRFPARLMLLKEAWDDCSNNGFLDHQLSDLDEKLSQMVQSAEAIDLDDIARRVGEIAADVTALQHTENPMECKTVGPAIEHLLKYWSYDQDGEITVRAPTETKEEAGELVVLSMLPPELVEKLGHQLEAFGYAVECADDWDSIKNSLEKNPLSLIINTDAFGENGHGLERMHEVQPNPDTAVPLIFISEHEDLETRLRAVRAGGQAYFTQPVEISSILERLDNYISPSAATPYRVLIIEDSRTHATYIDNTLRKAGMITKTISDPMQVYGALVDFHPELILMDLYMPHASGVELARVIRQQDAYVSVPIIYLSSESDPRKQLEALSLGGDDFLTKPIEANHLIASVRARGERSRALRSLMERDSLTGLLNHTRILDQLETELSRAERQQTTISFAMIDIDHFKGVNDKYGHPVGDRVIKSMTRLLQQRLRRTDTIGRYGGEEFAVIFPATEGPAAAAIVDAIRESYSQLLQHTDIGDFYSTFSAGITEVKPSDMNRGVEEVCERADQMLYKAKDNGRNQVACAGWLKKAK